MTAIEISAGNWVGDTVFHASAQSTPAAPEKNPDTARMASFNGRGVDAERGARTLVVAHREKEPAGARAAKGRRGDHGEHQHGERHVVDGQLRLGRAHAGTDPRRVHRHAERL